MKQIFMLVGLCGALTLQAENWAQFSGPDGRGISTDKGLPVKWTARNYKWQVKLPGIGHSSPVVWGNTVLITSAASGSEQRALRGASWTDSPLQSWTHHLLSSTRNYYDSDLDLRGSIVGFRCVFIEDSDRRCASPFLLLPRRTSCFNLRS